MLKLQSKGGKFDIVLSDNTLQDVRDKTKRSIRSLTSAGRRKTKELKSNNVMPKESLPKQTDRQKINKSKELKKLPEETEENKPLKKGPAKQTPKNVGMKEARIATQKQLEVSKTTSKFKSTVNESKVKGKKGTTGVSNGPSNGREVFKNTGVISQSELASLMEAIRQGDTSSFSAIVSKQKDQEAFTGKKTDRQVIAQPVNNDFNVTDSTVVPETDRKNAEELESLRNSAPKTLDSMSITSRNELQKEGMMSITSTPVQGKPGPYTSPHGKDEPSAMRSSFAVGAPGQVAYDYAQTKRDKNKQYLADLAKQIEEKKKKPLSDREKFIRSMEEPVTQMMPSNRVNVSSLSSISHENQSSSNQTVVTNTMSYQPNDASKNTSSDTNANQQSSFARGQVSSKTQQELEEQEHRRQKHLEHQRAVQEQVEEKRRLKMEERERMIREEREEEARLKKEQQNLALQYEEELKRKKEKEEVERQRHESMQKSVLQAYEAAQLDKQNSLMQKLKAGGHEFSRLRHDEFDEVKLSSRLAIESFDQASQQPELPSETIELPFQVSSRSDKGFKPIMNLNDDEKKNQSPRLNTRKNLKAQNQKTPRKEEVTGKRRISQNIGVTRGKNKDEKAEASLTRVSTDSTKPLQSKDKASVDKKNQKNLKLQSKEQNIKASNFTSKKQKKLPKEPNMKNAEEKDQVVQKSSDGNLKTENDKIADEHQYGEQDFSYKRSSTVTLQGETDSRNSLRINDVKSSKRNSRNEEFSWDSWKIPTDRQQQILEQLQALRKGLMDKKREYERGATPLKPPFQ